MPLVHNQAHRHPTQGDRNNVRIIAAGHIWIGGNPGIDHTQGQQVQRPVVLQKIQIAGDPARRRWSAKQGPRPMLRFQPQREALLPPDVLMNLPLKIEQH
jgi:hypothetical protein